VLKNLNSNEAVSLSDYAFSSSSSYKRDRYRREQQNQKSTADNYHGGNTCKGNCKTNTNSNTTKNTNTNTNNANSNSNSNVNIITNSNKACGALTSPSSFITISTHYITSLYAKVTSSDNIFSQIGVILGCLPDFYGFLRCFVLFAADSIDATQQQLMNRKAVVVFATG
jgi:hypothetical protein